MSTEAAPLMDAEELAAWLNIGLTKAYEVEAGRVRIGRLVRWDRASVQAWLDGQAAPDRPPIAFNHVTPSSGSPSRQRRKTAKA